MGTYSSHWTNSYEHQGMFVVVVVVVATSMCPTQRFVFVLQFIGT